MSASAEGSTATTKAVVSDDTSKALKDQQKPAAALEEDDEFEDFPVEGRSLQKLLGNDESYADEARLAARGR